MVAPLPVRSRVQGSFVLSQPPTPASSPAKEKDGLISPKPFSWATNLKNARLERAKTLYMGRGDWETVGTGHSTTIFFIMVNFTFSSVRADFGQNQAKPCSLGYIATCRMKSLTREISYDAGIRMGLLKQHFSNGGS